MPLDWRARPAGRRATHLLLRPQLSLWHGGRYELRPERGKKVQPKKRVDGKRDILGLDFYDEVDGALYHLREWVDCVRTRKKPSCPAEEGVRSAAAAHLANLSYRQGKAAKWSDVGG